MGDHPDSEAEGEAPKSRLDSWACLHLVEGFPTSAVAFVSEDLTDNVHWWCTQDHKATMAFEGLEWIESELFKYGWGKLPKP